MLLPSLFSYHINVGSTGLLFPYTLGALAYIKTCIKPESYKFVGISGGTWCSLLYHLEPNITDAELLWSIFVGNKNHSVLLLSRNSMASFQERVAQNFKLRYKDRDVSNIPISIITTKVFDEEGIKNVKISKFDNISDLVNYCSCSSYIPYISGKTMYRKYKNKKYVDGEIYKDEQLLLSNLAVLNLNKNTWNRKFDMKHKYFLNLDGCKTLFELGWQDAKKNM